MDIRFSKAEKSLNISITMFANGHYLTSESDSRRSLLSYWLAIGFPLEEATKVVILGVSRKKEIKKDKF